MPRLPPFSVRALDGMKIERESYKDRVLIVIFARPDHRKSLKALTAAQEILPEGAAVSSGIVMGLAWAAGSVGVLGIGVVADVIGPRSAALWAMPALLAAAGLALVPALKAHGRPAHHAPGT